MENDILMLVECSMALLRLMMMSLCLCVRCMRPSCSLLHTYCHGFASQAIIIDPVDVTAERDAEMVSQMGLHLTLVLDTHVHADHITGSGKLKRIVPGTKSVLSLVSGGQADVKVSDGDKIRFGSRCLFSVFIWPSRRYFVIKMCPS